MWFDFLMIDFLMIDFLMIDCFNDWLHNLYFTTIILLSDEISILWGECRPGGIFFPGPGFDSRQWQPVDTQGEEIFIYYKIKAIQTV